MLLTAITCVEVEEEEKKNYDGFQVLRTFPSTHTQLDTLHSIGQWSQSSIAIPSLHNLVAEEACEGWTPVSGGGGNVSSVDLLLAPRMIKLVKAFLSCQDIPYTTVILNLQRAIGISS